LQKRTGEGGGLIYLLYLCICWSLERIAYRKYTVPLSLVRRRISQ